ncbi:3-hydroxyacyl-CoA dehydrogenase NAD-binding domain-containing protein [Nocardioides nematodiphilus]|uniref:3-hydroxyacyl-CoA dehydrogenase NAD-binding domain-containing protein n=1 Tax=Nocardioides nematodiphilus TaxID=2849669 RepID=UPI001CD95C96|nr:3-hydroxyacyl-CoA dehydrogenase NAD-binding domain-containing protein [Nocardioides nematodiphilus]MCA1982664.1 enoyl-CoA hydratase/isomerase family protein [Nocardioides nematodiphilus]
MTDINKLLVDVEKLFSDDEVVTEAKLQKVTLPSGKVLGLVTLDNGLDHSRPNTFGPKGLVSLNTAYDAALADETIDAIAVTGKQFILAAGADLTALQAGGADGIRAIAELGHAVFRKLGDGDGSVKKPSFGFINGLALGGGLEVALHADYRTVIDSVPAVGLPEVMLGLVPGWGGAYLLPNLVGPAKAAELFIQNPLNQGRVIKGGEVVAAGIADVEFNGADYLEQSMLWADGVLNGTVTVTRPEIARDETWDEAVKNAGFFAWAKTGDASPAAKKAVELLTLAKTATRDEGFAAEDDALVAMAQTPELLASLYSFDLVQKRAKRPAGAPDKALAQKVTKVGIIGAGLMASQFALLFVSKLKVPVVMVDLDQDRADKGVAYVHAELDKKLAKGKASVGSTNRLKALVTAEVDYEKAFSDADFIIEAVFEEMSVKKKVFAAAEAVAPETAVFATNTSSLSITEMGSELKHPERVVGFHFFNPVAVMPLLEIIKGENTSDAALATAFATGRGLGKTTILVKDSPSFIVNRLLGRFMGEVAKIADEGTPIATVDAAFAGVTPMPPYQLIALVGPAIAYHNNETLAHAFPERFYLSENLHRVVEAKKGSFYGPDGRTLDPEVEALLEVGDVVKTAEEVRRQTLEALADEARRMLDEGVAQAAEDIDLGMITGAGFQFWNGGLTQLLDREGISEKVTGSKFH